MISQLGIRGSFTGYNTQQDGISDYRQATPLAA